MNVLGKSAISHALTNLERLIGLPISPVTILAYHAVSHDKTIVDITPEAFSMQIAYLRDHFQFITLDTVVDFLQGKKTFKEPAVALTFDDGYEDVFMNVFPVLKKYALPATVFALSDPKNADRQELENKKPLLSVEQLKTLARNGWIIGSHSSTHADFTSSTLDINKEVIEAKKRLENTVGGPIRYFAYPKGEYNTPIMAAIKLAGYQAAFTFESGFITQGTNLLAVPRMPVDATHSLEQFKAFFTYWGKAYLKLRYRLEKVIFTEK